MQNYIENVNKNLEQAAVCGIVAVTHVLLATIPPKFINHAYWASWMGRALLEKEGEDNEEDDDDNMGTTGPKQVGDKKVAKAPIGFRTTK